MPSRRRPSTTCITRCSSVYGYQGNPNLKPERSQNREAGLHYAANGQRVDAVYFDNRISDLIA